jgi:autotransporter-associated beta strand protein
MRKTICKLFGIAVPQAGWFGLGQVGVAVIAAGLIPATANAGFTGTGSFVGYKSSGPVPFDLTYTSAGGDPTTLNQSWTLFGWSCESSLVQTSGTLTINSAGSPMAIGWGYQGYGTNSIDGGLQTWNSKSDGSGDFWIGYQSSSAYGTLNVNGGTLVINASGNFFIDAGTYGNATVNITGGTLISDASTLEFCAGANPIQGHLIFGLGGGVCEFTNLTTLAFGFSTPIANNYISFNDGSAGQLQINGWSQSQFDALVTSGAIVTNGNYTTLASPTNFVYSSNAVTGMGIYQLVPVAITNAPTGLTAAAASGEVTLNWNTVAYAGGFNVYRSTISNSIGTLIAGNDLSPYYLDTNVVNGNTYYYVVSGTNSLGEGPKSAQASAVVGLPITPTGLTAVPGVGQISLSWNPVGADSGYNVYRSTTSGSGYLDIAPDQTNTSYVDSNVTVGVTYYYVVTGTNSLGESVYSAQVAAGVVGTASGIWTNLAGGTWSVPANWTNNLAANGSGQTADFSTLTLGSAPTVTLDGAFTVGSLIFGDLGNSYGWTLTANAAGLLTMDNGTNAATITVNDQTATINTFMAGTNGLVKGGNGTLILAAESTITGNTTVNAGTLSLHPTKIIGATDGAIRGTLTINHGATVLNYNLNGLGSFAGQQITNLNIVGGLLYAEPGISYEGWGSGLTINLTGGTIAGNDDNYSAIAACNGTSINTFATNVTSVISCWIFDREGQPGNILPFNVAAGTAVPDLLVSGVIEDLAGEYAEDLIYMNGPGVMEWSASNTYAGLTIVNGGTLALAATGSILGGPLYIQSGGNLAADLAGISPIQINNSLNLAGNITLRISKNGGTLTNDSVVSLAAVSVGTLWRSATGSICSQDTGHRGGTLAALPRPTCRRPTRGTHPNC